MTNGHSPEDRYAEWKKLFFIHGPAGVKAAGVLLKILILVAVGILFVRLALSPLILLLMSNLPAADGPKAVVLVSMVIGLAAGFVGVCICVYRYMDKL